jgi:hypothetical protein
MTLFKWSATAASNATADDTINARENQAPSTVNDAMRGMMAAVAKWRNDLSGNLVTAGTSTAYTLTTNQVFTSLTDGIAVAARMDEVNGAAPTLNVDSLGAKAIASVYGTAVGAGKLKAGAVYVFVYDSTDDKWIVQGSPNEGFEAGTKMLFRQTAAPTGWTKDTTYTDAALRVTSGTISEQATAGSEFSTLLANRTIAEANLPSHTHSFSGTTSSDGAHTHFSFSDVNGTVNVTASNIPTRLKSSGSESQYEIQGGATAATVGLTSSNGAHTHTVSGTSGATGSGTAMNFDVNFVDVIIATRA